MRESSGQEELGGGFGWCRIDSPFPEALLLWLGRDGAGVISALCGGLASFLYTEGGVYALVAFLAFAGLLFTPFPWSVHRGCGEPFFPLAGEWLVGAFRGGYALHVVASLWQSEF